MTKLTWGGPGLRNYESGVDRGVIYPENGPSVVWNGLTGVDESFDGGEKTAYYFDGIKTLEIRAPKTFQATISAFSAPKQLNVCAGDREVVPGFILTRQSRTRFGLSYRSMINGDEGYKIHLVYNAMATKTKGTSSTASSDVSVEPLSWDISAVPPNSDTFRPTAHFVLDSTLMDPTLLEMVETILYGTDTTEPRLLTTEELTDYMSYWDPVVIGSEATIPEKTVVKTEENLHPDPNVHSGFGWGINRWFGTGGGAGVYSNEIGAGAVGNGFRRKTWTASPGGNADTGLMITASNTAGLSMFFPAVAGDTIATSGYLRSSISDQGFRIRIYWYDNAGNLLPGGVDYRGVVVRSIANVWQRISGVGVAPVGTFRFACALDVLDGPVWTVGSTLDGDGALIEKASTIESYFDGDSVDTDLVEHHWSGTPYASSSIRTTSELVDVPVPGVYDLDPGVGDLTKTKRPGLYRAPATTRLAETDVDGLYRLEL